MDREGRFYKDGAIAVQGKNIAAVGETEAIRRSYSANRTIDATGSVILPGFVNAHYHSAMSIYRGIFEEMALPDWLRTVSSTYPHLTASHVYDGALLGFLEAINTGATTVVDMWMHQESSATAAFHAGIRACVSSNIPRTGRSLDSFTRDNPEQEKELEETVKFIETAKGKFGDRVNLWIGLHSPYSCPSHVLRKASGIAAEKGYQIHIHLAETREENRIIKEVTGLSSVGYLNSIGFLNKNVLAAHCVWLDDADIETMARNGVRVAHNPTSNMKLADGVSPIPEMMAKGISVGIGSDGVASNNVLDMLREMKTFALLHKIAKLDSSVLPSEKVLRTATIDGAKSAGVDDITGSLEPGKRADIIAVRLTEKPYFTPIYWDKASVMSSLVYAATLHDVDAVVCDGKILKEEGKITLLNTHQIIANAQKSSEDLMAKSGVNMRAS
jgi:5-methylthioadenosine/S-adenosylhomocysteine deaminase